MTKTVSQNPSIERTRKVFFLFDGVRVEAFEGESIAAALLRQDIKTIRNAPKSETPRGVFCLMGICQECLVLIEGRRMEACRTSVTEGLNVEKVIY